MEYAATPIATLVSVITLVLTGRPLTPVTVFMLVAFINALRMSLCLSMGYSFLETYDAFVSLNRLEDFFLLEDPPSSRQDQVLYERNDTDIASSKKNCERNNQEELEREDISVLVNLKDQHKSVHCKVPKREREFVLQDIEFTTETGSLTVITGPVGSGKSSLLSAIAGEVPGTVPQHGAIKCKGVLAYVPQIPWVFSGTIRENILFGEPYDDAKYIRVIEACALTEDIYQFPERDLTVVGERGAVLSGGQRARISLARAVYGDADIYLLDDPLSAVDFKVGKHIVEKCIIGALGQKTRLIASHQEQVMREADSVIVLYKGGVVGKGSFNELKEKGILNTTVDPLYKKMEESHPCNSFDGESEDEDDFSDCRGRDFLPNSEAEGLQISEEDRTIGVVSSKLYWNYFKSGLSSLLIFVVVCLCLITQGEPQ